MPIEYGKLTAIGQAYKEIVEERLANFADHVVVPEAQALCPVRRDTGDRRKGSRRNLKVPLAGPQTFHFGRVTITNKELFAAAGRAGRDLFVSQHARRVVYGKSLQVVTRKTRRLALNQKQYEEAHYRALQHPLPQAIRKTKGVKRELLTDSQERHQRAIMGEVETVKGALRRSIASYASSDSDAMTMSVRADALRQDGKVSYAAYVEFPTYKTAAQPFLLPALKSARGKLKAALKGSR